MYRQVNIKHKDTNIHVSDLKYINIITQELSDSIGDQLKGKRLGLGLTQKELADRLEVSRHTIIKIENNDEISINLKVKIIKELSLSPDNDYTSFLCNEFGAFITKRRLELGMTQNKLASTLGVSRKTIRHWEKEYSMPSYENYIKINQTLT